MQLIPINGVTHHVSAQKSSVNRRLDRVFFRVLLVFVLTPWASPPIALALGLLLALTVGNPHADSTRGWSQYLLQTSVVALGFGMNLQQVLQTSRNGVVYTFLGIGFALLVGFALDRILAVRSATSFGRH